MQYFLLNLSEKWKSSVDKSKSFGALITDLSKAFDCLDHELLTAKLTAYGFTLPVLRLIDDYLSNRKQKTKINDNYSSWSEILFGVVQGHFFFNIFQYFLGRSLFCGKRYDFVSYTNDSTPFTVENNVDNVIASLEKVSDVFLNWFKNNSLKKQC